MNRPKPLMYGVGQRQRDALQQLTDGRGWMVSLSVARSLEKRGWVMIEGEIHPDSKGRMSKWTAKLTEQGRVAYDEMMAGH